jgi:DNA repair exonuclease SbcCD ATPase subunit
MSIIEEDLKGSQVLFFSKEKPSEKLIDEPSLLPASIVIDEKNITGKGETNQTKPLPELTPDTKIDDGKLLAKDIRFEINIDPEKLPQPKQLIDEGATPEEAMQALESYFEDLNEHIINVIKAVGTSQSTLTQMANKWGQLPIWAKATTGITGGILVIGLGTFGFMAHMFIIPAILGVTSILAISSTLLLENHYQSQQIFLDEISKGFLSLASIFKMTIMALEQLRIEFSKELEKLKIQNKQFETNNITFQKKITSLTAQVAGLIETKELLNEEVSNIKLHANTLEKTSEEYKKTIQKLDTMTNLQLEINNELELDIKKIKNANSELIQNQHRLKEDTNTLTKTITLLTENQVKDDGKRNEFLTKLSLIISDRDEQLIQLAGSFSDTQTQLDSTAKELDKMKLRYEESNRCYTELLGQHKVLLDRHENLLIRQEQHAKDNNTTAMELVEESPLTLRVM